MRAAVIATTLAGVTALVPSGVPQKAVEAKVVDRRTVGAGLLSAIGAFSAQAAHASAGDSPKFSFFGIGASPEPPGPPCGLCGGECLFDVAGWCCSL